MLLLSSLRLYTPLHVSGVVLDTTVAAVAVEAAGVIAADGGIPKVGVVVKEVAARVVHDAVVAAAGIIVFVVSTFVTVAAVGGVAVGGDVVAVAAVGGIIVGVGWHVQCVVAAIDAVIANSAWVVRDEAVVTAAGSAVGVLVIAASVSGWRRKVSGSRG